MNDYVIYKFIFPNYKVYIGQTSEEFNSYMNRYEKNSKNKKRKDYNRLLNKSIRKYGWDNVKKEILFDNVSSGFVDELETYLIAQYKSADRRFGYNILEIGKSRKGYKCSEETKKLISKNHRNVSGENNPMFGIHRFGENAPNYGNKHSEKTKQLMKKNNSYYWKNKKQSEKHIQNRIKVIQKPVDVFVYKTKKFVRTFESIKQTGKELCLWEQSICRVLKNKQKSAGGYYFKYNKGKNYVKNN